MVALVVCWAVGVVVQVAPVEKQAVLAAVEEETVRVVASRTVGFEEIQGCRQF